MTPIRRFKRLRIIQQSIIILVLMVSAIISTFLFWAAENNLNAELAHSRTVADMADSLRTMVARQGGYYVRRKADEDVEKVGRYLAEYPSLVSNLVEGDQAYVFHQKNPFLALTDFSQVVQQSPADAKFKITSDNMMNPANQPDLFDMHALSVMRQSGVEEFWRVEDGTLRYARALKAEQSCLACHGHPDRAPAFVRMRYKAPDGSVKGGGYGYRLGEVVGVTSVTVPHTSFGAMLLNQSWGFWSSVSVVVLLIGVLFWLLVRWMVKPLLRLSRYADEIANTEDLRRVRQPRLDADEASSANEVHKQSFALKALHESMRSAIDHIMRRDR